MHLEYKENIILSLIGHSLIQLHFTTLHVPQLFHYNMGKAGGRHKDLAPLSLSRNALFMFDYKQLTRTQFIA